MRGTFLIIISMITWRAMSAENDHYNFHWLDPDKSVYVLQKKVHEKEDNNYFQMGYLMGHSTEFQQSNGFSINVGRYLKEEFSIEGQFIQYQNKNDNAYENIIRVNNTEPFIRKNLSSYGIMAVWSPFYGKINTFNKIFYFDISFGLGLASLTTESNLNYVQDKNISGKFDKENQTAVSSKVELKLYYNKTFFIHAQLLNHTYKAKEPQNPSSKVMKFSFDSTFGVGYAF